MNAAHAASRPTYAIRSMRIALPIIQSTPIPPMIAMNGSGSRKLCPHEVGLRMPIEEVLGGDHRQHQHDSRVDANLAPHRDASRDASDDEQRQLEVENRQRIR